MLWDLEFKRFETQQIREGVRQEYDEAMSKSSALKEGIKKEKDKEKRTKMEEQLEVLEKRDIRKLKETMQGLDLQIQGSPKCSDWPDGLQGTNQHIETLHTLIARLKKYTKNL